MKISKSIQTKMINKFIAKKCVLNSQSGYQFNQYDECGYSVSSQFIPKIGFEKFIVEAGIDKNDIVFENQ